MHVRDQIYFARSGATQTGELDPYTVVNVRVAYRLGERLSVHAGVDNLFDENYETSYGFPRAGRSAQLGASLSF